MKYIKFKDNNISKLSLGTVQFGINYGIANENGLPTQENINDILDYVCSMGINSFDTAQVYGNSEEVIGNYLRNSNNSKITIISKIDSEVLKYEEKYFLKSIECSINRLQINTLFGLLMHNSKLMDKWNGVLSSKVKLLKEKNLIKYFGVSIYSNEEFNLALNNDDIDIIQIPYNLFDQRALKLEWFNKAKNKNKLIFIRSIYLQGLLLMSIENIPEKLKLAKKQIQFLDCIAKRLNITKNELCLNFVNSTAKDSVILFGCETMLQAKQNLDIFNKIQDFDSKIIKEISRKFKNISENIYNPTKW